MSYVEWHGPVADPPTDAEVGDRLYDPDLGWFELTEAGWEESKP